MSEDSSPSLSTNLRVFRFQKKPTLSHDNNDTSLNTSSDASPIVVAPKRRRILAVSDSDSEVDDKSSITTLVVGDTTETVEKEESATVEQPKSEEDRDNKTWIKEEPLLISESEPKPPQKVELGESAICKEEVKTTIESSTATAAATTTTTTATTNQGQRNKSNNPSFRMKNHSVLEKERQMKFLLEIFPNLDAMMIHDILSKHDFDSDAAAAELSLSQGVDISNTTYQEWSKKVKVVDRKPIDQSDVYACRRQMKRVMSDDMASTKRKKVKRRNAEYDSDESNGSNHDYKDQRVFDSDEDSDVELSNEITSDKKRVLKFMETANIAELQLMNSCSKKKAEVILDCRPFTGWIDLVQKLQNNKNLSPDLLNAAQQVLITRNNIKILMKKCTSLAQQMERAVAAGGGLKMQPRNLSSILKLTSYQLVGLNWLVVLHNQGVNGILADEMGLGKTVQVISFLAHLKEIGAAKNTHLVVVPSSTLDNWRKEFARWCPELRVFMYHGSAEERRMFRIDWSKGMLADFDVILTTYTMVGNTPEERKMFRITPMHYVIFDEAHMLKNMNTQRYETLMRINAKHRILLTGTPLQNNLLELMSLLIFVMPKMFAEKADDIKSLFQKNSKYKPGENDDIPTFEKEQIEQAKRIMKPFVLRRLKKDVLQDLPKKTDEILHVPLAPTQKEQYEELIQSFQNADKSELKGISMMTDLRKLSNHPLLLRYYYDIDQLKEIAHILVSDPGYRDTKFEYILDDLVLMSDFDIHTMSKQYSSLRQFGLPDSLILTSGKFLLLDKMLPKLKQEGHRVLIFSQYVIMLNILEEYLRLKNHLYLRLDGGTAVGIRQVLIDEFTENRDIFIFLLSTRAGGLGINLTSADTVIIHDIDFNPYNDKQAEDRCHRMGQTKPVSVFRCISQGTIEDAMLAMNKEKLKLERELTTDETDNPDVKSVVRLLSTALGMESSKVQNFITTPKKEGL